MYKAYTHKYTLIPADIYIHYVMTTLTSLAASALAYVEGVGLVGKQPLRGSHKQSEGAGQHD